MLAEGSLPDVNRKNGVSKEEVASVTRRFFKESYPEKLEEKAETYTREKGWGLIWTPPYMPTFQPIELFWQHGKAYVSINFQKGRTMAEVWERIRLGLVRLPGMDRAGGGVESSRLFGKFVEHAFGKMNEWISLYGGNLSDTVGSLVSPAAPKYLEAMYDQGGGRGTTDE